MFRKKTTPHEDITSIGNMAVSKRLISKEQLSEALSAQEESFPLGQVLVNRRMITEDQLKDLLLEQKVRRNRYSSGELTRLYAQRARERIKDVSILLREAAAVMKAFAASGK
jgi:hypothetical protein